MSDTLPLAKPVDTASLMTSVRPALVRFFQRRCKNLSQAEDLAQDVIVRTLGRAEWETVDQAQGYLFRTAANLWRDQIRHHRAKGGAELSWDEDIVNTASAGVPLERALRPADALPDDLSERGRGLPIMRRCCDSFSLRTTRGGGTTVVLGRTLRHLDQDEPIAS